MSAWMNDAVANQNGNGFAHMSDPNASGGIIDPAAFMNNPNQMNAAQFANQAQTPGGQGDTMRHASPSFQNPAYQPNSVIPSKRPRPREDSVSESPRQGQGMLPPSRSDTPQQQQQQPGQQPQQQPGQPQNFNGMGQQAQAQFSHLQGNGSANATPSPVMGNQMRPGSVPQRVSTASPHPFSPSQQQQFAGQNSPAPSEHGTPQPNQFMQNVQQGFNPAFAASPSTSRPSPNPNAMAGGQMTAQQLAQMQQGMSQMQGNMYAQQQQQQQQQQQHPQQGQQQQRMDPQKMAAYQMRLQQQYQNNMQMQAQMQAQGMGRGMMGKQQMAGMPNGQMTPGAMRPQARPMGGMNPEQFMKNLSTLMAARGLPLESNPVVGDRPVNLMMLFQVVSSKGGYKPVTAANAWAPIAQAMGLPAQIPTVAPTLKQVYERNLLKFEEVWLAQQKQRMMQQQQQQAMANQGTPQKPGQPGQQMPQGHPQQAQQAMLQQQQQQQQQHAQQQAQQQHAQQQAQQGQQPQQQQQPQHPQQQTPQQQPPQTPQHPQHHQAQQAQQQPPQQQTPMKPAVNGAMSPQGEGPGAATPGHPNFPRGSIDPSVGVDPAMQSPAQHRSGSMGMPMGPGGPQPGHPLGMGFDARRAPAAAKSDVYAPAARQSMTYGSIDIAHANAAGIEIERWKPFGPTLNELGNVDISALTRGLQCGIQAEVRLALDTLATLASSPHPHHFLQLRFCDDLIDALVECGEEQLEKLAEHTAEVSDDIQLTSYEDVVRACHQEKWVVRQQAVMGTQDYELDRAVDKLICITTILRNASFPGDQNENHMILADELVIKFICVVIRYMGTRNMLLRTHSNTLDFMKDIIILLSNVAGSIELPSKEQALCFLHFMLAFAPSPAPKVVGGELFFASYEPGTHPYLPHAVDSLAKLFARDEPNRSHYRTILGLDGSSDAKYDLLTRTFGLAVSAIPDKSKEQSRHPSQIPLLETRKALIMQSLLSAEILASMAPGFDSGLTKTWLTSGNNLAQNLGRLIQEVGRLFETTLIPPPRGSRAAPKKDFELIYIVNLAVTLLRTLAEKARDPSQAAASLPKSLLPSDNVLMEVSTMQSAEWTKDGILQQLTSVISMAS